MESDKENACQQLEGAAIVSLILYIFEYIIYSQEKILLRTFMAFESEIASAMSVSERE